MMIIPLYTAKIDSVALWAFGMPANKNGLGGCITKPCILKQDLRNKASVFSKRSIQTSLIQKP